MATNLLIRSNQKKRDLFNLRADESIGKISPDDTSVSILRPVVKKIEEGATDNEILSEFEKALKATQNDLNSVEKDNIYKDLNVKELVEKRRALLKQLRKRNDKEYADAEQTVIDEINRVVPNDINFGAYIVNLIDDPNLFRKNTNEIRQVIEHIIHVASTPVDVIRVAKQAAKKENLKWNNAYFSHTAEINFRKIIDSPEYNFYSIMNIFKPLKDSKSLSLGDRILRNPNKNKNYGTVLYNNLNSIYTIAEFVHNYMKKSMKQFMEANNTNNFSKKEIKALGSHINNLDISTLDSLERDLLFKHKAANVDLKAILSKVKTLKKKFMDNAKEEADDARYQLENLADTITGSGVFPEVETHPALMREIENISGDNNVFDVLNNYHKTFQLENLVEKAKYLVKNVFNSNKKGKQYDKYTEEFYPDSYYRGLDHLTYLHHHSKKRKDTERLIREIAKYTPEQLERVREEFKTLVGLAYDANDTLNANSYKLQYANTEEFFEKDELFTKSEREFFDIIKKTSYHDARINEKYLKSLAPKPSRLDEFTSKSAKLLSPITIEKISKIFGGQSKRIRFQEFLPPGSTELKEYRLIDNVNGPHLVAIFNAPSLPKGEKHIKKPPQTFFAIRENTDDNGVLWSNIQSDTIDSSTSVYSSVDNMRYQTLQEIIRISGNKKVYLPTGQTNTYQQGNDSASRIYDKTIPQLIKRMGLHLEKRFINSKRDDLKDKVLEVWMVVGQDKLKTRPHELFHLEPSESLGRLSSGKMLTKAMEKSINQRHQNEIRQVLRNELKVLDKKQSEVKPLAKQYNDYKGNINKEIADAKDLTSELDYMLINADTKVLEFLDMNKYALHAILSKDTYRGIVKQVERVKSVDSLTDLHEKLIADLKDRVKVLTRMSNSNQEAASLIHKRRIIENILNEKDITPETIMKHIDRDERIFREGQSEFDYNNQQEMVYKNYAILREHDKVNEDNFEVLFFDSMANKYHLSKSNFGGVHFPSNIEHEFFAFAERFGSSKILISNIQQSDFLKQIEKGLHVEGKIQPRHPYTDKGNKLAQVVEEILTQFRGEQIYFPTGKLNNLQQDSVHYTGNIYQERIPKILKRLKVSFEKEEINTKYGMQEAYKILDRGIAGKRPRDLFNLEESGASDKEVKKVRDLFTP